MASLQTSHASGADASDLTRLTRRQFVRFSATALGGLLATVHGSAHAEDNLPETDGRTPGATPASTLAAILGAFVRIEPDGRIVIGARGCEIGQGVKTSLPMLIAEELDVAWSQVSVEQLPYELVPRDEPPGFRGKYGPQGAGGSTSISDGWHELRQAGARVRWMLVQAAAEMWGTAAERLTTTGQAAVAHPDGRRLSYAELASRAASLNPPADDLPLKNPAQFHTIGTSVRVADGADIVTGAAAFGCDAHVPGALTAVIARCPYFDGTVRKVDDSRALRVAGVRHVLTMEGPRPGAPIDRNLAAGVAVVADDMWSALKGREALRIDWAPGPWAKDSSEALEARARAAFDGEGYVARRDGDIASARKAAARVVEAQYVVPFLAHATLEPPNALVELRGDHALLIASLQSPGGASRMISEMTGIPRLNIEIRLPRSGGGFGRRLENDFVAEAVLIARAVEAPVKLMWTREDDLQNDFYRPFGVHALTATLDADGALTGWSHRVAGTSRKYRSPGREDDPEWLGCADPDGFPAGCVPHYLSEFLPVEFGIPRGWWRGPLPTFTAFAVQSFIDDVAVETGRDPLALRLELLGEPRELDYRDHGGPKYHTGRLASVLHRAATAIGYGRTLPEGHGIGLAAHFTFGGYAAHAMEVGPSRDGAVRIHRCVCAVDVGRVVNPLGLHAQVIGGTIDGLSAALNLQITVRDGRVEQRNFPQYPLLRMADAPDVEVHILDSPHPPSGAGEMSVPTAAPALTNAIRAATGKRIHRLPVLA